MAPEADPAPLSLDEFAECCAALGAGKRFAIAVSGGRDSMALARLAAAYADKIGAEVLALTVDHGLRDESAREAAQAAAWCKAVGLKHQTLTWTGVKPDAGVQDAARRARYRLLASAAVEAGCSALLTAHSADDQAETVFMRLRRGAGPQGLGAMRETTMIAAGAGAPIRLLRPLLPFARARLTATAAAYDQPYIDDPGNDDPTFERIRMRALLAAMEEQGLLTQTALLKTARRMARADARLRVQETALFQTLGGCFYRWGGVSLEQHAVTNEAGNAALAALYRRLVFAVSGSAYAPDEEVTSEATKGALSTGAATIGGALIKLWRERLWIMREPAALLGRTGVPAMKAHPLAAGASLVWDRRFIIENMTENEIAIFPWGEKPRASAPHGKLFNGVIMSAAEAPMEAAATLPAIDQLDPLNGGQKTPFTGPGDITGNVAVRALAAERFSGAIIRF